MAQDPTYDKERIEANPVWDIAFFLSEWFNDNAPLNWSYYIPAAEGLVQRYKVEKKP